MCHTSLGYLGAMVVNNNGNLGRRSFLRSLGVATAGLAGASGTVAASSDDSGIPEDVYLDILEYRDYFNWSGHRWRKVLAEYGYDFKYQDFLVTTPESASIETTEKKHEPPETVTVQTYDPLEDENSVGTNNLNEHETILRMTMTPANGDGKFLNFEWSLKDGWLSFPEPPNDFASFRFETSMYDFDASYDTKFGWKAEAADAQSALGPGYRVAAFHDNAAGYVATGRFSSHMDAKLIETTYKPPSKRNIYAEYVHRWTSKPRLTGVSAGASGGLTFATHTGMWRAETVATERKMSDSDGYEDSNPK